MSNGQRQGRRRIVCLKMFDGTVSVREEGSAEELCLLPNVEVPFIHWSVEESKRRNQLTQYHQRLSQYGVELERAMNKVAEWVAEQERRGGM